MKKIISVLAVFAMLLSASACGNYEITFVKNSGETNTVSDFVDETESEETTSEITEESEYPEWKVQYEKALQQIIDSSYCINAVCVNDNDGDGVPEIALSTQNAAFRIPNIIIDFKDGEMVVKDDIENSGSGWSVVDEVWFCEGEDYVIVRYYGNTTGTFSTNKQTVYGVSDFGAYSVVAEDEIILPPELEKEFEDLYVSEGGDVDITKFQNYIKDELDKSLYNSVGEDAVLVNYADVMKDFGLPESEEQAYDITASAVEYLNEQLGFETPLKPVG